MTTKRSGASRAPLLDPETVLEGVGGGDDDRDDDDDGAPDDLEPLVERVARAKKYLCKMPPAVQGQNGSPSGGCGNDRPVDVWWARRSVNGVRRGRVYSLP
jgi:hypothetical protein